MRSKRRFCTTAYNTFGARAIFFRGSTASMLVPPSSGSHAKFDMAENGRRMNRWQRFPLTWKNPTAEAGILGFNAQAGSTT
jgi:hypothetical protein